MLLKLLMAICRALLCLRYQVVVRGLEEILGRRDRQPTGILFLSNHPALIDPVILTSQLLKHIQVSALVDRQQLDRPVFGWVARKMGAIPVDEIRHSGHVENGYAAVASCIAALRSGRHLLVYPSGRLQREPLEKLGGKSGVQRILEQLPETRVVLVRNRGLWGSRFSWAAGIAPAVSEALFLKGVPALLLSGIFFMPRRRVELSFVEPADLPRNGDRKALNRYLEAFYNEEGHESVYVPYTPW